jgi:histidinol-phosphate aminotransferase
MSGIERFIRPLFQHFTPYSASINPETLAGKTEVNEADIVKMNANENPYGCSPRVLEVLAKNPHYHIYPDDGQASLRAAIAPYAGVPAARIVAGHGSNTLIDYITRLFVGPGDEVITCGPTFDLYRFSTQMYGGTVVNVPRDVRFRIDVDAVKKAVTDRTKLVFIASPNNPTGNATPLEDLRDVIETGVPVVIDEAYCEFNGQTVMSWVDEYENLMVLRSFSKWAGLAGFRVGYGVFPERVAACLMAIKIPHNVSAAAEIAVRASLEDVDYLMEKVRAIVAERERLQRELRAFPFLKPYPSDANFIFCDLEGIDATDLHNQLLVKGVLIRNFATAVRITAGTPAQTDALIKALRTINV